jgi:hypothetical protein
MNLQRASQWAHAVTVATLIGFGSNVRAAEAPAYCAELKQVATLALAKEKFASIIGAPREGSFLDANITLPGWRDCSFYGKRTYTCDSQGFKTAEEGEFAPCEGSRPGQSLPSRRMGRSPGPFLARVRRAA